MNLRDIIALLFLLGVYGGSGQDILNNEADEDTYFVNIYENLTLPCFLYTEEDAQESIYWRWEGEHEIGENVLEDSSLALSNVTLLNTGRYVCHREEDDSVVRSFHVIVVGPPEAPVNVSVHTSTVVAIVTWHLHLEEDWEGTVQGPKTSLHLRYRPLTSLQWHHLPHHISPTQCRENILHLQPNTTYEVQLWASNRLGESDTVTVLATTQADHSEMEMAKRLEESLNGFRPGVWVAAVAANVMAAGSLVACYFHHRHRKSGETEDPEKIELVPNIIENPGYRFPDLDPAHQAFLNSTAIAAAAV
ncbi:hypothetical protein Pmani_018627 [Petrolisthes manimaculis]|uniref:Uncharacterized protein n=1 Tax=Petrolisthes manimaculis TaxID=1843537 RepID=A0AAE1PJD8_9EUCA|nr:hypothetical protein Pmani_018627 [Petrolisthes manimaculis]